MNSYVRFTFDCGCFAVYWCDQQGEVLALKGGLSCCRQHEAPKQELGKILPLVLVKFEYGGT